MSEPRVRVGTGSASYSVDEIPEIVTIMGLDGRVEHVNASGGRILGRDPAEIAARWAEFVHPDDLATVRGEVAALLSMPGLRRTFTLRMAHPDGSWLHLETVARNLFDDPQIGVVVLHSRDVSVGHEATGRLAHERLHDHLTGLPTRGVFVEHLERALRRAARMRSTVAVFGLDLDGLSRVNQQHGYDRGDTLLVRVGHDLDAVLRADDVVGRADAVVARFEDSFFVLYEDVADVAAAAVIAARLVAAVPEAVVPGVNGEVTATATVGVVLSGGDRADAESLLVDATAAMHVGKANGGDRVEFFDIEVRHEADRRMADVAELRTALHEGQLHLHYQPLVDVRSGAIRAVEALARWQHPERGAVSPGEFIPLAESAGLIGPLGHWALVEACRQRARWNPFVADPGDLVVSVNVSSHQFDPSLPDVVAEVLDDSGAAPESLCIEITESSVITDVESAIATMRRLQEMGVRVSIDDFGSGYSSLAQLKRLPFDELKIDQSFVELLGRGHTDSAIVSAIVTMARALRLTVVAEGVETTTQLAELERLGCDIAQGFLFARPMSPADVAALLEAGRPLHPRP